MRFSQSLSFVLGASTMLAFAVGCAGNGNAGGNAAFAPAAPASSAQSQLPQNQSSARYLALQVPAKMCPPESAALNDVPLASAGSFAVLGGSAVTSAGLTVLRGNLGVSPGTSITGFGPGIDDGITYAGGPVAAQAQADLATAYNSVVARKNPTAVPADIGGKTITPGLYAAPVSLGITGTATLDGQNNPASVFIFQIPSTLTTAVKSKIVLTKDASACNIFWQVGSSATLGTASKFNGTIMAAGSISLGTGARVRGRVLAQGGAVTLLDNAIEVPVREKK
jgi:hypothetical protein